MFQGLATFLFIWSLAQGAFASQCPDLISTLQGPLDAQFIDQKIQNLSELKLSLDLAKVNGSSDIDITAMKAQYEAKEKELVTYLIKNKIMTRLQLIEKIRRRISMLQGQSDIDQRNRIEAKSEESQMKNGQENQIKVSVVDGTRAIFHKVTPGDFVRVEKGEEIRVHLTAMPEVMATSMSQIIYKRVAELANAKFPENYQIEEDPSYYKGDTRPVESVSYGDIEQWTRALNELSEMDEPALYDLIPSHRKGMRYSGFMTEAQREYLMKKAKTKDGDSVDDMLERKDVAKLKEFAVFGNSNEKGTALVDKTKPLFIDGKEFYGLHGNVYERVIDAWDISSPSMKGGTDPVGTVGWPSIIRGGAWSDASGLNSTSRGIMSPKDRHNFIGFRLVRIVE